MAIELKFSKSDSATPWGFRLVGGSDFEQPVVVVKVNENSLAEDAGLEVGDIIVRVNNTPTTGLTHTETHDLLQSAGLQFELGIRRDAIRTKIICDENYNVEVSECLREEVETNIIEEAVKKVESITNIIEPVLEETKACINENLSGQEEILRTSTVQKASEIKQGNKWSTFLIKPDKPVPKPQRKVVEETVKDEPYRVVIKKQQRRPSQSSQSSQGKKVQFDSHVTELEVDFEPEETEELSSVEMISQQEIQSVEVEMTETEETIVEEAELIEESESGELEEVNDKKDPLELKRPSLADIKLDGALESSVSLEEQLLAVQKQLQALSQLPSAIQVTLDAVSRQLANIVGARENSAKNGEEDESNSNGVEEDEPVTEEEILEGSSLSEEAEAEINRDDPNDNNSSIGEELEEDVIKDETADEERHEEEAEDDHDGDPYYGLTDEEKEIKIKEEQSLNKQKKVMDDRPPRPIQRPIILPGGRKWSNAEDAIPNFRKPKMSEEKIVETIESNLEVIKGQRKGINFLKYQPPPKNLDYLQRSEVYRLVHDMEPPVRGITSRAEKILAVQDYYEATKGAP